MKAPFFQLIFPPSVTSAKNLPTGNAPKINISASNVARILSSAMSKIYCCVPLIAAARAAHLS